MGGTFGPTCCQSPKVNQFYLNTKTFDHNKYLFIYKYIESWYCNWSLWGRHLVAFKCWNRVSFNKKQKLRNKWILLIKSPKKIRTNKNILLQHSACVCNWECNCAACIRSRQSGKLWQCDSLENAPFLMCRVYFCSIPTVLIFWFVTHNLAKQ